MPVCSLCPPAAPRRAIVRRPKTLQPVCKECFFAVFETEIHHAIMGYGHAEQRSAAKGKQRATDDPSPPPPTSLFRRGERVAIGASGGKDSTVLAHVMTLLNERYDYGLDLCLLSIDEGISGYRDASLDTVKRNAEQYNLPLKILSYSELYGGWTMDKVVAEIGKKGNCTYCGVFRRQALDRGASLLTVDHIVTGHNADDVAETVLMNVLRGDISRVERCTAITTGGDPSPSSSSAPPDADADADETDPQNRLEHLLPRTIKRSKPFKYAYEKEIVMYAYFKKLDYHSTECIYAPTAYRGYARALVKDLEAIRPSAIVDLIYSGEALAASLSLRGRRASGEWDAQTLAAAAAAEAAARGAAPGAGAVGGRKGKMKRAGQVQQSCSRCGSLSSQPLCQACMLLESLNKGVARVELSTTDAGA
ncbi:Ncs6p [Rhodotorula paludigena]|uniref:Ncs6p n=1 Tax=Rhodotorula paludigena TaxID=86838 RepID=UPI00317D4E00